MNGDMQRLPATNGPTANHSRIHDDYNPTKNSERLFS